MATATTLLSLVPIQDKEPNLTWEGIKNPYDLFKIFAQSFGIEAKFLDSLPLLIASDSVPGASDRSKIWIKTSMPYAIGVFTNGQYQMDYGPSGLIVNQPFLCDPQYFPIAIQGLNQLTADQISNFGLTDTNSAAVNRVRWYIFQPGAITI